MGAIPSIASVTQLELFRRESAGINKIKNTFYFDIGEIKSKDFLYFADKKKFTAVIIFRWTKIRHQALTQGELLA
ncbi:hypothetical protein [Edaphovirga cremea]|uniref:hypothetical protein n=1 Tax=Edaphovirga cremea TaxID=2267246 RepID=UPI000DEFA3B7|nr:hypothetical protein [Edaphovirga cremea]